MNRIIIIVITVLVILAVIGIFLMQKVGDIRPAILPSQNKTVTENTTTNTEPTIQGKTPPFQLTPEKGFTIKVFADEIGKTRDLTFSPEGILLASVPSEGRIIALPIGSDGSVTKKVVIDKLNGPHGIAFYNNKLFIAEENRLARYNWNPENKSATLDRELFALPSGGHDAHTIVFDKNGALFVKVGSVCNVCNETDPWRATVLKTDSEGTNPQVFAKGLRNAAFLTLHPETNEIWGTENGRDMLGDDLPPEEVNIIKEGKNYGWPICYGNKVHDTSFDKKTYIRNPCDDTEVAAAYMQAHSAPLGLSFIPENFSPDFKGDILVAFHGSWNRSVPTGYKVVRLTIENGEVREQSDFLTGFIDGADAAGRPVDLEFDKSGNLFLSDDKHGAIYIISRK